MRVHLQGKLFGQTVDVPYEANPGGRADVAERLSNIANFDYQPGIPDCPGCDTPLSEEYYMERYDGPVEGGIQSDGTATMPTIECPSCEAYSHPDSIQDHLL